MTIPHLPWFLLLAACLAWYGMLTLTITWHGGRDILQMLERLGRTDDDSAPREAASRPGVAPDPRRTDGPLPR